MKKVVKKDKKKYYIVRKDSETMMTTLKSYKYRLGKYTIIIAIEKEG